MIKMNDQYIMRLSIIFAVVFVGLAGASPSILWEDFDDGNGNGAFDPSFVHTIGPFLGFEDEANYSDTGSILDWEWNYGVGDGGINDRSIWLDDGTQDYVTFITESGQYVSHISVAIGPHGSPGFAIVGLYGTDGGFFQIERWDWETYEFDVSALGPIQAIQLIGGKFDDIRITVVPEPTTWILFVLGVGVTGLFAAKSRKDLFREFSIFAASLLDEYVKPMVNTLRVVENG